MEALQRRPLLLGLLAGAACAGCGAGTAAIVSGSGGSSGGGGAPAITLFEVPDPRGSPAPIRLESSEPLLVELSYRVAPNAVQAMSGLRIDGVPLTGNQVELPVSGLDWDFSTDLKGVGYRSDVELLATRPGGVAISGGDLQLGMGNDPPELLSLEPAPSDPAHPEESAGNVEIRIAVRDSTSDPVDLRVFWRRADAPADPWMPASSAGLFPDGITTSDLPAGVTLSFFWNTNVDLADAEDTVVFRVTAFDGLDTSELESLQPFRIDNNEEPIVALDTGAVVSNPDQRRGLPVPFRVIDAESDPVDVVFQWRREGEVFPSLDTNGDGTVENAEIDAILADPLLRLEHRICSEYPRAARGRVLPVDDVTVRLPELASAESWILASGLVGRALELLRPSSIPEPVPPGWSARPLVALPVGDGRTAIALETSGSLCEIELATGEVRRTIAPTVGPGLPSTMALERGEAAALVALDDAGTWRIERVDLATGCTQLQCTLAVSDGSVPAPVRGLASLGTGSLVLTVGGSLLHLDYRDPLDTRIGTLRAGLAAPWGVVVDPLAPHRVYVSEHDADRILAIDLDARGGLPVVVRTLDLQPAVLDEPGALALERGGARLLAVVTPPGGGRSLVGLELGGTGANRSFPIGGPLASEVTGLATGPDGLRVLCAPGSDEVRIAGGVEQRRVIVSRSASSGDVVVDTPFLPAPRAGQPWRMADTFQGLLRGSPQGVARTFLWDSADAPRGPVFLRATARDDEVGIAAEALAPKPLLGALEVQPHRIGDETITNGPFAVVAADLDGDGDLDLASANERGNNLTVFLQDPPGSFDGIPDFTLGGTGTTTRPRSVAAGDLDGDGDIDLVTANMSSHTLTVFLQDPPGNFDPAPDFTLGGSGITRGARSVAVADVDGDGDLDLVSANSVQGTLTVFLQDPPGSFNVVPDHFLGVSEPLCVVAADLDGDGDLDLASANSGSNDLAVFFQALDGSFGIDPDQVLGGPGTTDAPAAIAAADLDGDGDLDLVSANQDGNDLTVFFQDPPGVFAPTPGLTLGGVLLPFLPFAVAAGDLDGDGDLDLVSANFNGDNLTAWFQEAPGRFGTTPLVIGGDELTTSPHSVVAADLDGDGDIDLVSANKDTGQATADVGSDLMVFFQDSPGGFGTDPVLLVSNPESRTLVALAAADLDGDGDLDLAFANRDIHQFDPEVGSDLRILLQLSPGIFAMDPLRLGSSDTTNGPAALVVADLDGDGDVDLASANLIGNDVTVFLQQPAGFETTPSLRLGEPTMDQPRSLVAADLDGDGSLDLASANEGSDDLVVFLQRSGGYETHRLADSQIDGPCSVVAADLDGDGDVDLASANSGSDNLTVFLQRPGWFESPPAFLLSAPGGPCSIAVADLDGDGDLDLVSANKDGNDLTVFLQDPPGVFASTPAFALGDATTTDAPVSVAAADLDGDGDIDLVAADEGGIALTWCLQVAPGQFRTSQLRAEPAIPTAVLAVDIDGDGDVDLVSANHVNGSLSRGNLTVFFGGR